MIPSVSRPSSPVEPDPKRLRIDSNPTLKTWDLNRLNNLPEEIQIIVFSFLRLNDIKNFFIAICGQKDSKQTTGFLKECYFEPVRTTMKSNFNEMLQQLIKQLPSIWDASLDVSYHCSKLQEIIDHSLPTASAFTNFRNLNLAFRNSILREITTILGTLPNERLSQLAPETFSFIQGFEVLTLARKIATILEKTRTEKVTERFFTPQDKIIANYAFLENILPPLCRLNPLLMISFYNRLSDTTLPRVDFHPTKENDTPAIKTCRDIVLTQLKTSIQLHQFHSDIDSVDVKSIIQVSEKSPGKDLFLANQIISLPFAQHILFLSDRELREQLETYSKQVHFLIEYMSDPQILIETLYMTSRTTDDFNIVFKFLFIQYLAIEQSQASILLDLYLSKANDDVIVSSLQKLFEVLYEPSTKDTLERILIAYACKTSTETEKNRIYTLNLLLIEKFKCYGIVFHSIMGLLHGHNDANLALQLVQSIPSEETTLIEKSYQIIAQALAFNINRPMMALDMPTPHQYFSLPADSLPNSIQRNLRLNYALDIAHRIREKSQFEIALQKIVACLIYRDAKKEAIGITQRFISPENQDNFYLGIKSAYMDIDDILDHLGNDVVKTSKLKDFLLPLIQGTENKATFLESLEGVDSNDEEEQD